MSKKCRIAVYCVVSIIAVLIIAILIKIIFFSGIFYPHISIIGSKNTIVECGEIYNDPGAYGIYKFNNISKDIKVKSNIDTNKLGEYEIKYFYKNKLYVTRAVKVVDTIEPKITLNGNGYHRIFVNDKYEEQGINVIDNCDKNLEDKVKIKNKVNESKVGVYDVEYSVKDSSGNIAKEVRKVEVLEDPSLIKLKYTYDTYDNASEEWWFEKSFSNKRNKAARSSSFLKKYNAYYIEKDDKTIYLTLDEGGNNITYIKEIIDILNKNDVKATFFLTRNYILNNEKMMNDLVDNGHVIANHTHRHLDMPDYANAASLDKFVLEVTETEKAYTKVTGLKMEKIFRFPKGGYSERTLKILDDLGYTTYFWSHAYYDYGEDISKEKAYEALTKYIHNGAIYLIHPSNKGNYLAMEDFIKEAKSKGYSFDVLEEKDN